MKKLPAVLALLGVLVLSGCPMFSGARDPDSADSVQADLEKVDAILTIVGNELISEIAESDAERAEKVGGHLDLSKELVGLALADYLDNGVFDLSQAVPALRLLKGEVLTYLDESDMDPADRVKWQRRVNSAETLIGLLVN